MISTYRILRNRRPIGQQWILQEGAWVERRSNLTGRWSWTYECTWEREFACRRDAETFARDVMEPKGILRDTGHRDAATGGGAR